MRFRFLSIPVRICPSFWMFLIFFTSLYRDFSMESVLLGAIMLFSLLVHEYGHAFTALYFGARPEITLEAFGGYARYNAMGMSAKQRFLITLNGPLLESLLIVLPYFLLKRGIFEGHDTIEYVLNATMRLNIFWCLLNLIPVAPLDGGHILRYFLEKRFGGRGRIASSVIGLCCVAVLAPLLYLQGLFFFATLLLIFGFQNFQMLMNPSFSLDSPTPSRAYKDHNDIANGKALLKKLLKDRDEKIKNSAAESLAKIYLQEDNEHKAYELLTKADPQFLKEGKCVLCKLAFERKNYPLVGKYSRDIYEIDPSYEIAILNSQAFAHLNQPHLAGGWLYTASQFDNVTPEMIQGILALQAYDSVRDQGDFKEHVEKFQKMLFSAKQF